MRLVLRLLVAGMAAGVSAALPPILSILREGEIVTWTVYVAIFIGLGVLVGVERVLSWLDQRNSLKGRPLKTLEEQKSLLWDTILDVVDFSAKHSALQTFSPRSFLFVFQKSTDSLKLRVTSRNVSRTQRDKPVAELVTFANRVWVEKRELAQSSVIQAVDETDSDSHQMYGCLVPSPVSDSQLAVIVIVISRNEDQSWYREKTFLFQTRNYAERIGKLLYGYSKLK